MPLRPGRPAIHAGITFQSEHSWANGHKIVVHSISNLHCWGHSGNRCTSCLTTAVSRWHHFLPKMTLEAGEGSQQELSRGAGKSSSVRNKVVLVLFILRIQES